MSELDWLDDEEWEQIMTPIDIPMQELSKAIETAKRNAEFFTDDFKEVLVSRKPVEISIENAETILAYLQRRTDNVISKMVD